ncbi:MAG: hypothetical protein U9R16_00560 [Campylobacterota bacterium]|nr:hypothetical protein [Campylobacterota bacterium]
MDTKDYKTIIFFKFGESIGAIKSKNIEELDIQDLLFQSFIFLNQNIVLTTKQQLEYNLFKDKYNDYLDYCIENNFIRKNSFKKIDNLNTTTVPDMSNIKIPDISKELKDMDIDLDNLANVFSKINV